MFGCMQCKQGLFEGEDRCKFRELSQLKEQLNLLKYGQEGSKLYVSSSNKGAFILEKPEPKANQ